MIIIKIPGRDEVVIENVVFDFNGTMATDGILLDGVSEKIKRLAEFVNIYILSSDTFNTVEEQCEAMPVKIIIIENENGGEIKQQFVENLGATKTACIGNGLNDSLMFSVCILSVIILSEEGCSVQAMLNADIVVKNIFDALELFFKSDRIIATLRK